VTGRAARSSFAPHTAGLSAADALDVMLSGLNARLTFGAVERDHLEGSRKVVTAKVIVPTAELVRIARQVAADPGERSGEHSTPKQLVTLQ
jgi:hypothetical protein